MKTKIFSVLFVLYCITLTQTVFAQTDLISNGSFETGDSTDWTISTINGVDGGPNSCARNWIVLENSTTICDPIVSDIFPSDGTNAAFSSFDSTIAETTWILEQTVSIPDEDIESATVIFTFEARLRLDLGDSPTESRAFRVELLETDGTLIGEVWSLVYPAVPATFVSTHIDETVDVLDMIDGLEGTDVVLRFSAFVPEVLTGPAKALVDNVSFTVTETLSVDNNELSDNLSIYPNPASDFFELNYTGNQRLTNANIYDINGRLIKNIDLTQSSTQINVSDLTNGLYFLEVNSSNTRTTERLIIR